TENEYALAWEAYNELVAAQLSAGSTAHALLGKGQAAQAEGEIDSARSAFSSVLKPESPPDALFEAYRSLGLLEFDNGGSPGKVRELLKSALKIAVKARIPRDSRDEIAVIAALSWAKEGDLDRARRELEAIIKPKRRSSRAASAARSELIRIAFQQGDLEEMRNQINALLISDPSSEYANDAIALAALLTDLKDSPDAVRALGKADLADFMSDSETAIHILDSLAISGSPRLVEEALWRMYRIELNRRRFESALGLLNRIIDLGGAALRADLALFHAGQICEENTGNQQMAAEFYERLLVEYPDSPLIDRTRRRLKTLI
ncbi:MAG TPA: tetratricopeptide repeat protein, partial [Bacteroidetes bacterium]|nr:tetratricopeptide repeat protein [Bacteroidota bacterium]